MACLAIADRVSADPVEARRAIDRLFQARLGTPGGPGHSRPRASNAELHRVTPYQPPQGNIQDGSRGPQGAMREYVAEKIADPARAAYVRDLFSRIAPRYDLLNRVMTGGRDRRWRAITVAETRLRRGGAALDVATGTGDLARALARVAGPDGRVGAIDFAEAMLEVARRKAHTRGGDVEVRH